MADYSNSVITQAGIELLAKCEANETKIRFTAFKTGDGEYTDAEKLPANLTQATALKSVKQSFGFNSISREKNVVKFKIVVSNKGLMEGYRFREMGIFARAAGEDDSEAVLFAVSTVENAEYIPVENPEAPYTIMFDYATVISNDVKARITVAAEQWALAEDVEEINTKLSYMTETSEADIMSIIDGTYKDDGGVIPDMSDIDEDDITDADVETEDINFDDLFDF